MLRRSTEPNGASMRLGWLILAWTSLLALQWAPAQAQQTDPSGASVRPSCVGLVLGGGGARGAAHIGVLRVLERERVPICAIAGTSMGAIVGSLYAVGYTPDEIEGVLKSVNWKDVLDDDPDRPSMPMRRKEADFRYLVDFKLGLRNGRLLLPRGLVQGQKLDLLLRRLLLPAWKVEHFDDLPTPFRCVGTDIGKGEGVVFDQGDLALAVRASMSVPGAFAPIRVNGRLMVDGGLYNNVPVDVVRGMGADRVIVVDVGAPLLEESELGSPFAISMQMLTMLMMQRTEQVLAAMQPGDISIRPQLGDIGSADFDRAVEAIPLGEEATSAHLDAIRGLAVEEAEFAAFKSARLKLRFDAPLVDYVNVVGGRSRTRQYVADRFDAVAGNVLDTTLLEADVGRAYGQGNYERISWRFTETDGKTGIEVLPVDKGWGPNFVTFGLQLDDDFQGGNNYLLAVEGTVTGFNERGGEWRTRAEIGRVAGLRTELHQPWGRSGNWFVEPALYYEAFEQPIFVGGFNLAEYRIEESAARVGIGRAVGKLAQWELAVLRGRLHGSRQVGDISLPASISSSFGAVSAEWLYDSLDSAAFPTRGQRHRLRYDVYRTALGSDDDGEFLDLRADLAWSRGRHNFLLGAQAALSWGEPGSLSSVPALGGLGNLSSRGERSLIGENTALVRGIYYRRFGDMSRLFSVPAYVGGSIESGNVWLDREDFWHDRIDVLSLFVGLESPLGPILFGYGLDDEGERSVHLSFGSLLRP